MITAVAVVANDRAGVRLPLSAPISEVVMRSRAFRRAKAESKMWRRLKEDRNQHFSDLSCPCWTDKKAMARFKEQPQHCSGMCCGNQRLYYGAPISERRQLSPM